MAKNPAPRGNREKPLLTPPRAELKRALRQAARDAQRLADAYGVKVPSVARDKP
jgi:hypothetical protein